MSSRRALPLLVAVAAIPLGASAVRAAGPAAARPCIAPESNRHHLFKIDLNGDKARERILVYNLEAGVQPVSMFMVCTRVHGQWVRVQRQTILESPGAHSSGLVDAWAGDLNKDGRVEIAARDFVTPSVGEVLSVYRQTSKHSLRFSKLQGIGGDQVRLHPHPGAAATVTVLIRANHAVDSRRHLQIWRWSTKADRWTCRSDCGGFGSGRGIASSAGGRRHQTGGPR